ncbi:hypothetical protein LX32DRAFT_112003 [Colletotrichum zoysiae]|uniref:Uncharacterized protein n=1 Tax=Colletotrichum zoysiae TaxID=1216348 RepID=A0AAD9LX07_9PEZI|nr:hypothetical protein LX32DRAFT_112003 [Colletotrichum zoysiae]
MQARRHKTHHRTLLPPVRPRLAILLHLPMPHTFPCSQSRQGPWGWLPPPPFVASCVCYPQCLSISPLEPIRNTPASYPFPPVSISLSRCPIASPIRSYLPAARIGAYWTLPQRRKKRTKKGSIQLPDSRTTACEKMGKIGKGVGAWDSRARPTCISRSCTRRPVPLLPPSPPQIRHYAASLRTGSFSRCLPCQAWEPGGVGHARARAALLDSGAALPLSHVWNLGQTPGDGVYKRLPKKPGLRNQAQRDSRKPWRCGVGPSGGRLVCSPHTTPPAWGRPFGHLPDSGGAPWAACPHVPRRAADQLDARRPPPRGPTPSYMSELPRHACPVSHHGCESPNLEGGKTH